MKQIVSDWGVDLSHFYNLYKTVSEVYGSGVSLVKDSILLDNKFAKGAVDFFPLNNKIALLRINVLFLEIVSFKRILQDNPDYYACLFSLKEGIDLHVFDSLDEQEMNSLGMSAKHSVLYFSADVQTLFRVMPNGQTKVVILVLKRDALSSLIPSGTDEE
jgi:hypothetical protein